MATFDEFFEAEEGRLRQADNAAQGKPSAPPVEQKVVANDRSFDAFFDSQQAAADTRQQAVLRAAAATNPDRAGEANRLARRYPAPQDVLLRNLQDAKLQAAVEDADARLQRSPALGRMMQALPFAQVAHDDTENLSAVEAVLGSLKAGVHTASRGVAGAGQMIADALVQFSENATPAAPFYRWWEQSGQFGGNPARRLSEGFAQIGAQNKASAEAARPKASGVVEAGIYSGLESLTQSMLTLPMAFAPGGQSAAMGGMVSFTGGDAYQTAREQGMRFERAVPYAASQAAIEYATEKIPLARLIGDVKAGTPFFQTLARQVASEVPGEQLATLLQDLNEWAALPENKDKPFAEYIEARPSAAAQTLVATLVGVGGNVAVGEAIGAAARTLDRQQAKARSAEAGAQQIEQINALATESKVLKRDPESFAAFVEEAAAGGPVQDVFISAEALAQSGLAEQVAAASPSVQAQFVTALQTGGDIKIPVAEYATTIAGQAYAQNLIDHLRLEPDGMSRAEAQEFMKTQGDQLRQQVEQAMAATQEQADAGREAVQAQLLEQLNAAGRFTDDVNTQYATLASSFYDTQAQRLGTTARDLFERYPLRVQAVSPVGAALSQNTGVATKKTVAGQDTTPRQSGDSNMGARSTFAWTRRDDGQFRVDGLPAADERAHDGPNHLGWAKFDSDGTLVATGADWVTKPSNEALAKAKEEAAHLSRLWAENKPRSFFFRFGKPPKSGKSKNAVDGSSEAGVSVYSAIPDAWGNVRFDDSIGLPANIGMLLLEGRPAYEVEGEEVGAGYDGEPLLKSPQVVREIPRKEILRLIGADSDEQRAPQSGGAFNQAQRGAFTPGANVITLFKAADLSTFLHELGHFQLEVLADIASQPDSPAPIQADMKALLDWFGVAADGPDGALATWNRMTLDQKRGAHEQFARGFEAYLFEGQAPSVELRGVFSRLRAWLVSIYRQIKALDVTLTDEVRGVMDRLLASEDQIRDAEAAASMGLMFKTPEEAAKFGVDWQSYHDQAQAATDTAVGDLAERGLKDMQWLSRAKARELKKLQKAADGKRRDVEAEVKSEIMARPVYQAWAYLTGKHPVDQVEADRYGKLDAADLTERYGNGDGSATRTLAARGMLKQGGEDPDITAELFGYDSGDAMVQALASALPPDEVVANETDRRMLERYGDITSPEALEQAANEAVHNAARARFLATELKALEQANDVRRDAGPDAGGRRRTASVLPEAAKQFAADLVARLKVRDIRPLQYRAAEARAARAAEQALKAGDLAEAALAKRNQLINHHAAKAAYDAQVDVSKALRYLARAERSEGIDSEYRDQIAQLLARFNLRREPLKDIDGRKSLQQWVEQQREAGYEPDIPPELLAGLGRQSYRDMTVEEIRGLVDTVKQIEHLGRLKKRLLTARDKREYEAVRDELVASVDKRAGDRKADTRTPTTNTGRWWQGLKNFGAAHIKAATWARIMDGGQDGGPVWEYLIRPANERGDWETTRRAEVTLKLHEILKPWRAEGKTGGKGVYFPSIGQSKNRESVLAIALNTGNAGNLQRLLGGEGWTLEQIKPVLDTLTEKDWQVVQQIWDLFETLRPEIAAKERRVYGKEPNWVEPTPVVTKFGTLRGGYYPIKYDTQASGRAEENANAEEAAAQLKGAHNAATTRRTFTKARVDEVQGRPLVYTLNGLYSGLNDVIHDLAWHEWLIDANRLLRSDKIDTAIREHYGPEAVRQLKTWKDDIATGDSKAQSQADAFWGVIRRNVSLAGLALNVKSALMQPLGFTQSIVRIGGKAAARGLAQYIANPVAATRSVNAQSEFMRNRAKTRFRELNEIRGQVQGGNTVHEHIAPYAFILMLKMQQMVDVPTWLGAYDKAIADGNDHARAVHLADQAVIDSQGGGQLKDLSALERGGATHKLFTVFYSFMNTALNLGVAQGMSPRSAAKKAVDMLMLYTVPPLLAYALVNALTPGDSGDEDEIVKKLILAQAEYLLGLVFGVRELAPIARALTGSAGAEYKGPAGLRPIGDTIAFGVQAYQGEFDDAFRKASVNLAGDLMGLPSAQINRTWTGAEALNEGKTENPAALLTGYQEPR